MKLTITSDSEVYQATKPAEWLHLLPGDDEALKMAPAHHMVRQVAIFEDNLDPVVAVDKAEQEALVQKMGFCLLGLIVTLMVASILFRGFGQF